jgi:hypothetical protein
LSVRLKERPSQARKFKSERPKKKCIGLRRAIACLAPPERGRHGCPTVFKTVELKTRQFEKGIDATDAEWIKSEGVPSAKIDALQQKY